MIKFEGVSKLFQTKDNEVQAVADVDLSIKKSEIFGVIGFSGAGKSTLLRLVNLLEVPTSGKVIVNDQDVRSLKPKELRKMRQGIGMIFQNFNLFHSRNVYGNIAYPLKLAKLPKDQIDLRVRELLRFVGLEDKADHYPEQLSGGQKQRVGIARALATSPNILICDEATSALDPETTEEILNLLKKVNEEYHVTILLITHEMQVIRKICDRVAVMENGQVIEVGSIYDIFTNPKKQTTKNFIRSVLDEKIPKNILTRLSADNANIYRFIFSGDATKQPLLSKVAKKHQVDVNILYGNITELQGTLFGNLIVELKGSTQEINHVLAYLEQYVQIKEVTQDEG